MTNIISEILIETWSTSCASQNAEYINSKKIKNVIELFRIFK